VQGKREHAEVFSVTPGTGVQPSAGPGVTLMRGIHVLAKKEGVDGRDKPGHDDGEVPRADPLTRRVLAFAPP